MILLQPRSTRTDTLLPYTTLCRSRRAEEFVVGAVAADDAARTVPGAAADGAALVHAVHRLGDEVLGEVAGIGERPAVATGTVVALADGVTPRGGVPIVVVLGGVGLGLVREGQQLQQVVVVDPPVELAAPEIVVAVGVPGLDRVDVPRVAVAVFIHAEEEQPVLDRKSTRLNSSH